MARRRLDPSFLDAWGRAPPAVRRALLRPLTAMAAAEPAAPLAGDRRGPHWVPTRPGLIERAVLYAHPLAGAAAGWRLLYGVGRGGFTLRALVPPER